MKPAVAVLFDNFGPYHWARLNALCEEFDVLAIETYGNSSEYPWAKIDGPSRFERKTLFERAQGSTQNVSGGEVTRRVTAALDCAAPSAVFIPGWATAAALAALTWCLRNWRHAIVMSESTAQDDRRRWHKEIIKKRVVRLFSAGLVGGQLHADYLTALGMPRAMIFPGYDVVDNDYFAHAAAAARQDEAATRATFKVPAAYFLASSRFIPKKNLPGLLQAYAAYRAKAGGRHAKLVLLGDGPSRAHVLEVQKDLSLDEDLILPGFVQYQHLPAYYAFALAFVHASTIEPWGLVVNEAMACGLPVIVSNRCGCAGELVKHARNGYGFDPANEEELAETLLTMTGLSLERRAMMGQASLSTIAGFAPAAFALGARQAWTAASSVPAPHLKSSDALLLRVLSARL
jgi:glycosyltransferase involved in cell wall biosynthesis